MQNGRRGPRLVDLNRLNALGHGRGLVDELNPPGARLDRFWLLVMTSNMLSLPIFILVLRRSNAGVAAFDYSAAVIL